MKITANQLTILRIVSLPIPCVLLYGGFGSKIAALFLFALLAFTDYLDGLLARRHGTTPFGTLFDPIADKIFITVVYIPFVQLGYIPLWTAVLLFLREFLITEIRRLLSQKKLELRVTELAKSKTTLQMAGGAFILLVHVITDRILILSLFSLPLLGTLVMMAVGLIRRQGISHRVVLALCCFSYILAIRFFFTPLWSAFLYMLVIIGFTYASGLQYALVSYPVWPEIPGYPIGVAMRLASGFITPVVALVMLHFAPHLAWMAILILSFDFASQGLDTWISTLGREEKRKDRLKHAVLIPVVLGVGVAAFFVFTETGLMAFAFLCAALVLSTLYMAADFYGHRKLLVAGMNPV
jgi:CDP-diacylglycerol--glycerol-3-phosphate 3-phosphatidyltransferase